MRQREEPRSILNVWAKKECCPGLFSDSVIRCCVQVATLNLNLFSAMYLSKAASKYEKGMTYGEWWLGGGAFMLMEGWDGRSLIRPGTRAGLFTQDWCLPRNGVG